MEFKLETADLLCPILRELTGMFFPMVKSPALTAISSTEMLFQQDFQDLLQAFTLQGPLTRIRLQAPLLERTLITNPYQEHQSAVILIPAVQIKPPRLCLSLTLK